MLCQKIDQKAPELHIAILMGFDVVVRQPFCGMHRKRYVTATYNMIVAGVEI
jgi:hypothetical protein